VNYQESITIREALMGLGVAGGASVEGEGGRRGAGTGLYEFADNLASGERDRLLAIDQLCGVQTRELLVSLGVGPGWRCVDVGAGAGTVARWLAEQVGPSGHVVATDRDPRLLRGLAGARVEVRCADITREPLREAGFDLVFARAVLCHLPERDRAVRHMLAGLRPGGLLVVHDFDIRACAMTCPDNAEFARAVRAVVEVMTPTGWDADWCLRQPVALMAAGARDVGVRSWVELMRGGSPEMNALGLTFSRVAARMADVGLVSVEQMARIQDCCGDPSFACLSPMSIAAWGYR
jgi:SAM-dependent methyltransferase